MLGKLSERPTYLDNSRTRGYCARITCAWLVVLGLTAL